MSSAAVLATAPGKEEALASDVFWVSPSDARGSGCLKPRGKFEGNDSEECACNAGYIRVRSLLEDPGEGKGHHPVILSGKSHGRRSLAGTVYEVSKSTRLRDFTFTFWLCFFLISTVFSENPWAYVGVG